MNEDTNSNLGRGIVDLKPLDPEGRLRINDDEIIISFGRHRGLTLKQVWNIDREYIFWLQSPSSKLPEDIRNMIKNELM